MKKTKQMLKQENEQMRYALGRILYYHGRLESKEPTEYGHVVDPYFFVGAVEQITKDALEKVGAA